MSNSTWAWAECEQLVIFDWCLTEMIWELALNYTTAVEDGYRSQKTRLVLPDVVFGEVTLALSVEYLKGLLDLIVNSGCVDLPRHHFNELIKIYLPITWQKNFRPLCIMIYHWDINMPQRVSIFSWRFMKWNATIIVLFFFFNPHELTKIVLQNIIAPNCTIWSSELNQKGFSCFPA